LRDLQQKVAYNIWNFIVMICFLYHAFMTDVK
jgi:hypothetical protein